MDLSIIIPVYNGEKYIKRCIDSIINVCNFKYEILVINDGSTDNTESILNEIKKLNNGVNLKIFNNKNNGVSYSRNFGISKAIGKWICFVDSDDIMSKKWYNIFEDKVLNSNSEIVYISQKINELCLKRVTKEEMIEYILCVKPNDYFFSTPWSKFFKKELIKENDILFETKLINGEDMLFNLDALKYCKKYSFICENVYIYMNNLESVTHRFNTKMLKSDIRFHELLDFKLNAFNMPFSLIEKNKNYCKETAIYMLINNFTFLNNYELFKREMTKLTRKPYSEFKIRYIMDFKHFVIILFKIKFYYLLYILVKLKNKIKRNNKEEYIYI